LHEIGNLQLRGTLLGSGTRWWRSCAYRFAYWLHIIITKIRNKRGY